jgi:hypothetical protein
MASLESRSMQSAMRASSAASADSAGPPPSYRSPPPRADSQEHARGGAAGAEADGQWMSRADQRYVSWTEFSKLQGKLAKMDARVGGCEGQCQTLDDELRHRVDALTEAQGRRIQETEAALQQLTRDSVQLQRRCDSELAALKRALPGEGAGGGQLEESVARLESEVARLGSDNRRLESSVGQLGRPGSPAHDGRRHNTTSRDL